MTALHCRTCGREFSEGEQFCSQDGTRLDGEFDAQLASGAQGDDPLELSDPPAMAAAGDPLVGTTLDGRYRILRVIGEGGMGVVYEALHVLIEKHVAIKVLRDTFTGRADVVERFRQEAKSASKIGHPNIVDVSDFGETPSGQSYIVMEMLIGEDLADVLARERALPPARSVRIAYQIARALHATHKKGIVHRDLKPENIYLVERDGAKDVVKIVDFGVAKMNDVEVRPGRRLTRTGMLFGTPEYMSPEQALGKPFDHRVDIYALGAILFELVAGRVPFTGENFMEILAHHGHTPLPSLHTVNKNVQVSPVLEGVIARALSKDPDGRHQSMGAFADDLRSVPEMCAANFGEILAVSEWPGSTGAYAPVATNREVFSAQAQVVPIGSRETREGRTSARNGGRSISPPPLPERDAPAVGAASSEPDEEAVTLPRARPAASVLSPEDRDIDLAIDDGRDAVLLTAGAELRSNAKLGLGLVVLASAVLGVLILQRSHASLRSLPSVHSDAPAAGLSPESEQSMQAATAVPATAATASDEETIRDAPPALIGDGAGLTARPVLPPGADSDPRVGEALPSQLAKGVAHTRPGSNADSSRPAWMTRAESDIEATVEVLVRTVPRGASVGALGTAARCEPTPCALIVPKDRAVTLRAEARNTSVQKTFTFNEHAEVELRLSNARNKAAAETAVGPVTKSGPVPHAPSDLKVPSIFR